VHLFPVVRVTVKKIEAESMEQAIDKAEEYDYASLLNNIPNRDPECVNDIEFADEMTCYLVDKNDGPGHHGEPSVWYGPGKEKGQPDLFALTRDLLAVEPKELPKFLGINPTTDKIIALRLAKE
jgi:hypothetical protein